MLYFLRVLSGWCALAVSTALLNSSNAYAIDSTRNSEIKECVPGEIVTWGDGVDKAVPYSNISFLYIPNGAPPWFNEKVVLDLIQRAASVWSECGIFAQVSVGDQPHYMINNEIVIQWSDSRSQGNIGASDISQRRLYLSPGVFKTLKDVRPTYDGSYTLQMTLAHEMGHFYGLGAHSRRCVDVLSYYKSNAGDLCNIRDRSEFGKVIEYRSSLPTACDIQRCRRINNFTKN